MGSYRADWVLPIADEPIRDGFVTVENGRVTALGAEPPPGAVDLGRTAILPSLVNAHTHLELSYLHRQVPPNDDFHAWITTVMARRREYPDAADPTILDAARRAIASARGFGTGLVADISNTLVTVPLLREAGLPAQVFHELLGFNVADAGARVLEARQKVAALGADAGGVRISLAPHAPYSVAPSLFQAIREDLDAQRHPLSSVHLGESAHEVEFLRKGSGVIREMLAELGVWDDEWRAPGTSPVEYLSDLGFLDRSVLAVHGVQFDGEDLTKLGALGVTVVSCPRSNRYVGVGSPPIEAFYAMDVDVAFGTDSLASADDLNVFAELAEARRLAPRVPASRLLESATLVGARALGFESELGSIEPGKRASLLAVRLPAGMNAVEEYLVGGVEPEAITWLDRSIPGLQ